MTTKPTAAELAEAQATLDVHNAANGTHLKIEQPDPWEIQGFIDGYGDGRAAWSTGVDGPASVLAYLADALGDTDTTAFLIRRSSGSDAEHARLVGAGARERLARHLFLDQWVGKSQTAEGDWAHRAVLRGPWLTKADAILAVLAGREG